MIISQKKQITSSNGLNILARVVPQIMFATISGLTAVNPTWGVLFVTAMGIITAWGDFGQSRINELISFISKHKEEFVKEVIEGDNFKTLFLNILERHMKEASEEKRRLLRNYLFNMGKGIEPDFNEYSRMNNTLDNISFNEINLLRFWDKEGPIEKYFKGHSNRRPARLVVSDLKNIALHMNPRIQELIEMVADEHKKRNNQTLLLLGYKGLLYTLAENNVGSGEEAKVVELTSFGKAFLAFIK